ncbi:sun protein, partial [mine drainage metagenome]
MPCSGTGVIRRHPDIKLLRRVEDVASFAARQLEILRAAFELLAPGGRLVYATCSVLPEENEGVLERFYAQAPQARTVRLPAERLPAGAVATTRGLQLLTGGAVSTDGFYMLVSKSNGWNLIQSAGTEIDARERCIDATNNFAMGARGGIGVQTSGGRRDA